MGKTTASRKRGAKSKSEETAVFSPVLAEENLPVDAASVKKPKLANNQHLESPPQPAVEEEPTAEADEKENEMTPMETLLAFQPLDLTKALNGSSDLAHPPPATPSGPAMNTVPASPPSAAPVEVAPQPTASAVQPSVAAAAPPSTAASTEHLKVQLTRSKHEYDALAALYATLQASLEQANQTMEEYKLLHANQVKELNTTVQVLVGEREILNKKLMHAPAEGISLAQHQALLEQIAQQAEQIKDDQAKLKTSADTLAVFQEKTSQLLSRVEDAEARTEEAKQSVQTLAAERDSLVSQVGTGSRLTAIAGIADRSGQGTDRAHKDIRRGKAPDTNRQSVASLSLEKGDLESKYVSVLSKLAADEAKPPASTGLIGPSYHADDLEERLKEECAYSASIESVVELYESLTGLQTKNMEVVKRSPLDKPNVTLEYMSYSIRQKGSCRGLVYKLLVPKDKTEKTAYIPPAKSHDLPEWLQEEMEFESHMARLFFGNVFSYLSGEPTSAEGHDLDQVE
ncbi:hypothetical protein HDU91_006781 [Kappamyces sp. JEL0680]|nr:hypothetical protein HDU91_006781 [Kappamyces sp. JEL0680]